MWRSNSIRCRILSLIVLVLVAGCSNDLTPRPDPTGANDSVDGKPLISAIDPPPSPPEVFLVRSDSARIQSGVLFKAEWIRGKAIMPLREQTQVPWPSAVPVARSPLEIEILTTVFLRTLTVQGYSGEYSSTGEPAEKPQIIVDCWLDELVENGPCQLQRSDRGTLLLALPPLPEGQTIRLSVYSGWPELGLDGPVTDWATWLIALDT